MMSKYILSQIIFLLLIGIGCKERSNGTIVVKANMVIPEGDFHVQPAEKKLDIEKSSIKWKGTKMMHKWSHEGTVDMKEGVLLFDNDRLVAGHIISDIRAIRITDLPAYETEAISDLTNHLMTDFNTKVYPTSRFDIITVEYINEELVKITGDMTIKGVTNRIYSSAVIHTLAKDQYQFEMKLILDRLDWNIGIDGSWLERKLVDDEMELKIKIVTK